MTAPLRLPARLQAVGGLIIPGSGIIDIGCDHALLDIALRLQGRISWAIGTDDKREPLTRARANIARYGVSGIELVQTDGVVGIDRQADAAVLSGMGFHTAAAIIERSRPYFSGCRQVIVQVNAQVPALRRWLTAHGLAIDDEVCVVEAGQYYEVIMAVNGTQRLTEQQAVFGPVLLRRRPVFFLEHHRRQAEIMRRIAAGLPDGHADKEKLLAESRQIEAMLEQG